MTGRRINKLVVHCSATQPLATIGAAEIDKWHRQRGFSRIGYHYVIRTTGDVEFGRDVEEVGAHAVGHNKDSIGICLVGGIDRTGKAAMNFTSNQMRKLADLLLDLKERYPDAEVLGHRDLSPDKDGDGVIERHEWMKECPCFDVRTWWSDVQRAMD